jgi:hypothetical protein
LAPTFPTTLLHFNATAHKEVTLFVKCDPKTRLQSNVNKSTRGASNAKVKNV